MRFGDDLAWNLVDAAPDGIVMVDESGTILLVNRQTEELFGYEHGELLGRSVEDLLPERLRQLHGAHRAGYRAEPRRRAMGVGMPLAGWRKDGTEFPLEISLSPMRMDDELMVIAVIRDITERVAVESELRMLEEHERIARDLHDIVIQQLFASGMTLQGVWSRIREPEVAQRVTTVIDDLDRTIREIRSVIFGLQSSGAEARGVRTAITDVVGDAATGLQAPPRIYFDGPVDLIGDAIVAELLPTLREALSNIARHAKATTVTVTVSVGEQIELRVTDDGVGIDDELDAGGNGIRNMSDRAARLGGHAVVYRGPEGGTVVEWSVPREAG
jgi:PAS domain S-box-containing protein